MMSQRTKITLVYLLSLGRLGSNNITLTILGVLPTLGQESTEFLGVGIGDGEKDEDGAKGLHDG